MSTEPTNFITLMNIGKAFFSLDGKAYCYQQYSDQFQFLQNQDTGKPSYWISWDLKKPSQFI